MFYTIRRRGVLLPAVGLSTTSPVKKRIRKEFGLYVEGSDVIVDTPSLKHARQHDRGDLDNKLKLLNLAILKYVIHQFQRKTF